MGAWGPSASGPREAWRGRALSLGGRCFAGDSALPFRVAYSASWSADRHRSSWPSTPLILRGAEPSARLGLPALVAGLPSAAWRSAQPPYVCLFCSPTLCQLTARRSSFSYYFLLPFYRLVTTLLPLTTYLYRSVLLLTGLGVHCLLGDVAGIGYTEVKTPLEFAA